MDKILLKTQRIRNTVKLPTQGTPLSSGLDVYTDRDIEIPPRRDFLFPTGLKFDIPSGYDLSVYNKSGISTKKGLINGANLIDSDYTGEVHIHLFNLTDKWQYFKSGEKLAQLVLRPVIYPEIVEVDNIEKDTIRGENGFGSTGN